MKVKKRIECYLQSAIRKYFPNLEFNSCKNILQEERKNKDIFKLTKTRVIHHQQTCYKRNTERVFIDKKEWS